MGFIHGIYPIQRTSADGPPGYSYVPSTPGPRSVSPGLSTSPSAGTQRAGSSLPFFHSFTHRIWFHYRGSAHPTAYYNIIPKWKHWLDPALATHWPCGVNISLYHMILELQDFLSAH